MKHKILIIDDSIVNINALYLMLKESYQVFVAKSGDDGIAEAKKNDFSLILLNILMPGMDGFEVLAVLKSDPGTKKIPVMFISSLNDDQSEEKGLAMGAVDMIAKPLNPSVIKVKVKNYIDLYEYQCRFERLATVEEGRVLPDVKREEKATGELNISLFGGLSLSSKTENIQFKKRGEEPLALLVAFLILKRNQPYTKKDMIQAVWGSQETEDIAPGLNELGEEINRRLHKIASSENDSLLLVRESGIYWNHAYHCLVDTELFERLFQEIKEEQKEEEQYKMLESALQIYKKDFLVNSKSREWVVRLRERYQEQHEQLLEQLLELCWKREEYEKIEHLCQRELYEERWEEKIHWYYMKALLAMGRKRQAEEHYAYMMESYPYKDNEILSEVLEELYLEIKKTEQKEKYTAEQIENGMKEEKLAIGAYYCDFYTFGHMYRMKARNLDRSERQYYLGLLGIEGKKYGKEEALASYMRTLFLTIQRSMRVGDVFSKIEKDQYAILFPCKSEQDADGVLKRIAHAFYQDVKTEAVELTDSLSSIHPAKTIQTKVLL